MTKPKRDDSKTNYRTPPPPENVSRQLCDIANAVNAIDLGVGVNAVIKGWWIWIEEPQAHLNPAHSDTLKDMGFFCSKNTGKWYYRHPMAPNHRGRRYNSKSGKQQVKSSPKTSKPLTERDRLEEELAGLEKMYQTDSGENHININKMIADVKVKIEQLGVAAKLPLQEFVDKHAEKADVEKPEPRPEPPEEKPAPTAEQLRNFFKK